MTSRNNARVHVHNRPRNAFMGVEAINPLAKGLRALNALYGAFA